MWWGIALEECWLTKDVYLIADYLVPEKEVFPKPNLFCPYLHSLRDVCHIYQAPTYLKAQNQQ
jgi:hypothetical protein